MTDDKLAAPSRQGTPSWFWATMTVLVPLFVTAFAQMSGIFQKDREIAQADVQDNREHGEKMVELGLGILRTEPIKGETNVRKWAMDLVQQYSGVPMSKETRDELQTTALPDPTKLRGWVAIGMQDNPSGSYFTLPDGKPIKTVSAGMMVKAKVVVNVRPEAASWGRVVGVLQPAECFAVSEATQLPASGSQQTWARGESSECGS